MVFTCKLHLVFQLSSYLTLLSRWPTYHAVYTINNTIRLMSFDASGYMQYHHQQLRNLAPALLQTAAGQLRITASHFFGVYFGFLGNGMGPRRRHQEVLSKQREDGGNFKPPGSLLNRHISYKTLTAHWPERSAIVEVCGRAIC